MGDFSNGMAVEPDDDLRRQPELLNWVAQAVTERLKVAWRSSFIHRE